MKKMPTIFERDAVNRSLVTEVYHKDCHWVRDGEGEATKKYDGTSCLIRNDVMYRRRMVRDGNSTPKDFENVDSDSITGKSFGWVPVTDDKGDRWHREAFFHGLDNGTYELIGPKIQNNAEKFECHMLISHSKADIFPDCPRDPERLREWFIGKDIEGIVFHHEDGRMAKIKKKDFGIKRKD